MQTHLKIRAPEIREPSEHPAPIGQLNGVLSLVNLTDSQRRLHCWFKRAQLHLKAALELGITHKLWVLQESKIQEWWSHRSLYRGSRKILINWSNVRQGWNWLTIDDGAIKPELPKTVGVHITPRPALDAGPGASRLSCSFSLLYGWKCLFGTVEYWKYPTFIFYRGSTAKSFPSVSVEASTPEWCWYN